MPELVSRETYESIYYEAHVTVEPVFDERNERFIEVCKKYKFHVAKLLMKKRASDTAERSMYDSFCTTRSKTFDDIKDRTLGLVKDLEADGFDVWRYKIEDTLLDSKNDDSMHPLEKNRSAVQKN